MANRFIIEELLPVAARARQVTPARFEWDVDRRSIPFGLSYTLKQHINRTHYPSSPRTSQQVLGPEFQPFTLEGVWQDKYNPQATRGPGESLAAWGARARGYAEATRAAFEDMTARGNPCRFTWRTISFVGIVGELTITIRTPSEIGYRFTVEPEGRARDRRPQAQPSPRTALDPRSHAAEAAAERAVLLEFLAARQEVAEVPSLPSNLQTDRGVRELGDAARELAGAIDKIEQGAHRLLDPAADALAGIRALATTFAVARGAAQGVLDRVASMRSDLVAIDDAVDLARFEAWFRGLRLQALQIQGKAYKAERDIATQIKPDVVAVHRARPGESLYAIALHYYGTPDAWTVIAERNAIPGYILEGGELLLIPATPAPAGGAR